MAAGYMASVMESDLRVLWTEETLLTFPLMEFCSLEFLT